MRAGMNEASWTGGGTRVDKSLRGSILCLPETNFRGIGKIGFHSQGGDTMPLRRFAASRRSLGCCSCW